MTEQFQDPNATNADQAPVAQTPPVGQEDSVIQAGEREFKSVDDVTKYYTHSQAHIGTLESENKQLRERLEKVEQQSTKVEEVLAKLESTNTVTQEQAAPDRAASQSNEFDIDSLLEKKLAEQRIRESQQSNYNQCMAEAKSVLGDDYLNQLNNMQQEIGLNNGVNLAKESPEAFKKLFLSNNQPKPATATSADLNFTSKYNRPAEAPSATYNVYQSTSSEALGAWAAAGKAVEQELKN